jgi:hypothetical protein
MQDGLEIVLCGWLHKIGCDVRNRRMTESSPGKSYRQYANAEGGEDGYEAEAHFEILLVNRLTCSAIVQLELADRPHGRNEEGLYI